MIIIIIIFIGSRGFAAIVWQFKGEKSTFISLIDELDVFKAYENPVICQSEIEVHVSGEDALDFGGVTRDVFCSFWDQLINNSKVK